MVPLDFIQRIQMDAQRQSLTNAGFDPDDNDSWARVEFHRWQHGCLPMICDEPLDVSKALNEMADAIERGDPTNFPTPFNVVSVLRYVAKRI